MRSLRFLLTALLILILVFSIMSITSCEKEESCTEHQFCEWETVTKAGCESEGKRTRKCENCDETEEAVKALGHSFTSYVSDGNATCIDGTKTATCANGCGKTDTVSDTGSGSGVHSMAYARTTQIGCETPSESITKCVNCDHTEAVMIAPASGHFLTSYTVESQTKADGSDCTYTVTLLGSCGVCSGSNVRVTKTETIHSYFVTVQTEATCKSAGLKSYKCTACSEPAHTASYTNTDAHSWNASGTVVNGVQNYVCGNNGCGVTKSVIAVMTDTHTVDKSSLASSEIKLGGVEMKLDSTLVSNLASGNVTLTAKQLTDTSLREAAMQGLSAEQKEALNGKPIYDFEMSQSGSSVSDFNGGKITVTVPYSLGQGEDPECITVWYLAENGVVEYVPGIYSDGKVTFAVSHFSAYAIVPVKAEDACKVSGHSYKNGESNVMPTCTSVGYTVKVCTRCGESAVGSVIAALGHSFNDAPAYVEPTCTALGEYTYTCSFEGCEHKLKVPIPYSHDWQYKDGRNSTCQTDGYTLYGCSKCEAERKDIYPRDTSYHDTYLTVSLVEGATDCADGVDVAYRCKNDGCDYYEYGYTITDHLPADKLGGDSQVSPECITVDLDEYLTDLKAMLGDNLNISATITKSTCACGKVISQLNFNDEGGYFSDLSSFMVYEGDFPSESSYNDYTFAMGPSNSYTIRVAKRIEDEGCKKYFYVDVLIDYDSVSETAGMSYSYLISTKAAHNLEEDARLAEGSTLCSDGIIRIWKCTACQKITSESEMSVNGHYYIYNRLPFDMSEYSTIGHKAIIKEGRCPCGMSKYTVSYPSTSKPQERCSFVNTETVTDGNTTVKTYACSCGVTYREKVTVSDFNSCTKRTYQFIEYGEYDADTDTFDKSVGLKTHIDTFYHSHKNVKSYTYNDGCYVEYTVKYVCDCGDMLKYSYDSKGYEHSLITDEETDGMGNVITTERCEDCGYVNVTAVDENGNYVRQYSEIIDPKSLEKTVTVRSYRLVGEISEETVYKKEVYDLSGNPKGWEQTVYIYVANSDGQGEKLVYTLYSDGRSDFASIPLY